MLHGRASGTYPFLASMKPKDFVRLLSAAEITLGSALLLPIVSGWPASTLPRSREVWLGSTSGRRE